MKEVVVGIIGGSGLGQALGALGSGESLDVETPFGPPSAPIVRTQVDGVQVALLPRHGIGHVHNPSRVPYRANVYALKSIGVTHLLVSGAVGSLKEEIAPRHLVVPDQVIDRTHKREATFFDDFAVHVELAAPFCSTLRALLLDHSAQVGTRVHPRGTLVCMEGPQFSSRAESELHRSWGADLIGMTVMPEAKLAREAGLCYAMVALPTDYDCWKPAREGLDEHELMKEIIGNLKAATDAGLALIRRALPAVKALAGKSCPCQSAFQRGLFTDPSRISEATRRRLAVLLDGRL